MARVPDAAVPHPSPAVFSGDSGEVDPDDLTQIADPNDADSASKWVGRTVADKYHLDRVLGLGGMGAVYAARHAMTGKKVAVKVMHAELARSTQHVARFLREAKSASAIGHPSIVDVLDAGKMDGGRVFLVMELLVGSDLEDALRRNTLSGDEIIEVVIQLLDGLSAAHARDVIHRDIKPENVFVERDEQGRPHVKVLDFGIAKHLRIEPDASTTRTGTIVGTPEFMSPEQAKGEAIDGRSDVWSTGALLFYALTGRPPFTADNYNKLIVKLLTESVPSVALVRPDLPAELIHIVDRALASDRNQRWATARDMADALRALRDGTPPAIDRPPPPGPRLNSLESVSPVALTLPDSGERPVSVSLTGLGATLASSVVTERVRVAVPRRSHPLLFALVGVVIVAALGVFFAFYLGRSPSGPQAVAPATGLPAPSPIPAASTSAPPVAPGTNVVPPSPHDPGTTVGTPSPRVPAAAEPEPASRYRGRTPRKAAPVTGAQPSPQPPPVTRPPNKVPIGPTRNYD